MSRLRLSTITHKDDPVELLPPEEFIKGAQSVLTQIDLDPWSSRPATALIQPARSFIKGEKDLSDVMDEPWEGRVALWITDKQKDAHGLLHKLMREYQTGRCSAALVWFMRGELISRHPWIWDHMVCIPFRRIEPLWYDRDLETTRTIHTCHYSYLFYMPPTEQPAMEHGISRFHSTFASVGRIVYNTYSGEGDWQAGWKLATGRKYRLVDAGRRTP